MVTRWRCTRRRSSARTWSRWPRSAASPRAVISRASPWRSGMLGMTSPRRPPAPSCRAAAPRAQHPAAGRRGRDLHRISGMARRAAWPYAGAIAFKRAAGLQLADERCIVGESSTSPYAVRITEPGAVNVFQQSSLTGAYLAALPLVGTPCCMASSGMSGPLSRWPRASFRSTLQNGTPANHLETHAAQCWPSRANPRRLPVLRRRA